LSDNSENFLLQHGACTGGLSANDMEKSFKDAGADYFLMKPFPCEKIALRKELSRMFSAQSSDSISKYISGITI